MQEVLILTNEELIQEIKSNQNVQSNMYQLYYQNLPLIKQWSNKYIKHYSSEDILQECYIALHQAVQTFELDKGYKFTTYLQKCIITHLSRQSNKYTGVKLNADDKKLLMEYISLNNQQQQATGESISDNAACCKLHCSEKQLNRIKQYMNLNSSKSLEEPTGEGISISGIVPDNTNIEQEYEDQDTKEYLKQIWNCVDNICDEQSANVINHRYKYGKTLKQIGDTFNKSPERIRTIESKALKKLRNSNEFKSWAADAGYYFDIALHYGYNSWKYNRCSSVEYAVEIMERKCPKPSDYNNIEDYIEADLKYREMRYKFVLEQKK